VVESLAAQLLGLIRTERKEVIELVKTADYELLPPTDEGYAGMRELFIQSSAEHREDVRILQEMLHDQTLTDDRYKRTLLNEALTMLITERQRRVQTLNEQIVDIGRYLANKKGGHSGQE
jgi:hypothetical protein